MNAILKSLPVAIGLIPLLATGAHAVTTLDTTADTYIKRGEAGTNFGSSAIVRTEDKNFASTETTLGFFKFNIAGLGGNFSAASFNLDGFFTEKTGTDLNFRLVGINEGTADEIFNESTLTFTNSSISDTTGDGFDNALTTTLLDFTAGPSTTSVSLSSPELLAFINADTNDTVTLMVQQLADDATAYRNGFASRESTGFTVPQLVLTAVPEPSSALLGALGSLFLLRRKR